MGNNTNILKGVITLPHVVIIVLGILTGLFTLSEWAKGERIEIETKFETRLVQLKETDLEIKQLCEVLRQDIKEVRTIVLRMEGKVEALSQ